MIQPQPEFEARPAAEASALERDVERERCERQAEAMFALAMASALRDERLAYLALAEDWARRAAETSGEALHKP